MSYRTIQEYMSQLTAEDAAIYARVVERADGYLPMIAADTRDANIMRGFTQAPDTARAMSDKMTVAAKDRIRELETELAECRNSRQREHDLRVTLAGELESFKIRYQDEVNARVNAEDELDTVRSGFVAELRKAKAALAETRMAFLHQSELLAQARHAQAAHRAAHPDWYLLKNAE